MRQTARSLLKVQTKRVTCDLICTALRSHTEEEKEEQERYQKEEQERVAHVVLSLVFDIALVSRPQKDATYNCQIFDVTFTNALVNYLCSPSGPPSLRYHECYVGETDLSLLSLHCRAQSPED